MTRFMRRSPPGCRRVCVTSTEPDSVEADDEKPAIEDEDGNHAIVLGEGASK